MTIQPYVGAGSLNIFQGPVVNVVSNSSVGSAAGGVFDSALTRTYSAAPSGRPSWLDALIPNLSQSLFLDQRAVGSARSVSYQANRVSQMIDRILAPILLRAGGGGATGWAPLRDPNSPSQALASPGLHSTTLEPGVLRTMLSSTGGQGINYNGQMFGVRGGRFSSEIDRNETLIFKAPLTSSGKQTVGARVDLASFYSREGGVGEKGAIEVYKGGQLIDSIAIAGTRNGRLSVDISKGFDELRFKADTGRTWGPDGRDGSDFGLAGITLHQRDALPPPPPPPPPPSPPPIVERRIAGEALGGSLASSGGAVNYIDGSYGIQGKERDEIDRGETMYFRTSASAGKEILGAKVDLAKIFSNGREHEAGFVEVYKGGQLVDKIAFNGTAGGTASVDINKSFDELRFTTDGSKKSDYALGAVTLRERDVAPAPPAPLPVPQIPATAPAWSDAHLDRFLSVMTSAVSSFTSLASLARSVNADESLLEIASRLSAARRPISAVASGEIRGDAARNEMRWTVLSMLHGFGSVTSQIGPILPDNDEGRMAMSRLADTVVRMQDYLRFH